MKNSCYILFISGPTGSGKTDFSLQLSKHLVTDESVGTPADSSVEIINADVGQFYTALSVGTAKPDWKNAPIKHHLFDIINEPALYEFNVVNYRDMLLKKATEIYKKGKLPIVVGGSLFYIRSLFFPPLGDTESSPRGQSDENISLWKKLQEIDPKRANEINPSDTYRIQRALSIWKQTGKKPSEQVPEFNPGFHARILFINLPREHLYKRINQRTEEMINDEGWLDEVRGLVGTSWEHFLKEKKLIGYPEIFDWLGQGEMKDEIPSLIERIQIKTRNYAKRQVTFWKKFRTLLETFALPASYLCKTETIEKTDEEVVGKIAAHVKDDLTEISHSEGRKGDQ